LAADVVIAKLLGVLAEADVAQQLLQTSRVQMANVSPNLPGSCGPRVVPDVALVLVLFVGVEGALERVQQADVALRQVHAPDVPLQRALVAVLVAKGKVRLHAPHRALHALRLGNDRLVAGR
jgi:hypothetical protein